MTAAMQPIGERVQREARVIFNTRNTRGQKPKQRPVPQHLHSQSYVHTV